jgi:hypothetical protein
LLGAIASEKNDRKRQATRKAQPLRINPKGSMERAWGERGAAKILGLHPNTFRSRMKKLRNIRAPHEDQQ